MARIGDTENILNHVWISIPYISCICGCRNGVKYKVSHKGDKNRQRYPEM